MSDPRRAASPPDDLCWARAHQLSHWYATGQVSPLEVTRALLERIGDLDQAVNAFVTVTPEAALADAAAAEQTWTRARAHGDQVAPLLGVPYALKDLVPTAGIRTARGSTRTADWVPDEDSPLAARLRGSGGVLMGKTTTSEVGWKADAGNPVNGPARNPHDPSRTAGGSSGGAAAAVAAGFIPLAQGGDGAGSVRIPASFCGVVGIKPSPGVVPYYPPTPLGPMVANGPMGRSVLDAALLLDAMSGPDPRDPSSMSHTVGGFAAACAHPHRPLRIGYVPELGGRRSDAVVSTAIDAAVERLRAQGHDIETVEDTPAGRFDLLHTIWTTGFASLFPDGDDGLDPGLAAVVAQAAAFSGADLAAAHLQRQELKARMAAVIAPFDILITPTVATPPFQAGADHPDTVDGTAANYLDWAWLTYTFNLTEQPALSLPCATTPDGLPVGLQVVGHHHRDLDLVAAAAQIENLVRNPSDVPSPRAVE